MIGGRRLFLMVLCVDLAPAQAQDFALRVDSWHEQRVFAGFAPRVTDTQALLNARVLF